MAKFRKKPVVIEAVKFLGWGATPDLPFGGPIPDWLHEALQKPLDEVGQICGDRAGGGATITTLEGPLHASPGDWIIRGVEGELYPCKPDIFAKTHEPAEKP